MWQWLFRLIAEFWSHIVWDGIKELTAEVGRWLGIPSAHDYAIWALLILAVGSFAWRFWRKKVSSSRLALDRRSANHRVKGIELIAFGVTNRQSRFENTCHNVHARLVLDYAGGDRFVVQRAQFLAVEHDQTISAHDSVSLNMLERGVLCIAARVDGKFFAVSHWPVNQRTDERLKCGEWRVQITLESDAAADRLVAVFILQLNPDGSTELKGAEGEAGQPCEA